mmetsp:Transcript_16781/g.28491  ORF Transcript_16781/g.28491 Transcript_16781/m.28491 type:complete len:100 (+) Transcript_16781:103-402(+)
MGISYEAKEQADKEIEEQNENARRADRKHVESIILFGPSNKIFKFMVKTREWERVMLDPKSSYKGSLKHSSVIALQEEQKIIVMGGVSIATNYPLANVF